MCVPKWINQVGDLVPIAESPVHGVNCSFEGNNGGIIVKATPAIAKAR